MDVYVLNQNFEIVSIVDSYTSFIWTDRFYKAGDFELYLPTSKKALETYIPGYYLWNKNSEHMMIIEDIKTTSDVEDGNNLTITGRSLESILDRRIIWDSIELSGSLQGDTSDVDEKKWGFYKIIYDNFIITSIPERAIPNFIFEFSNDPAITTLTIEAQYNGENIYDVLTKVCEENHIGFKITLNTENQFVFQFYTGVDRSYIQNDYPFIIFSPNFENIINSEYRETRSNYKNVALVAGEGEGSQQKKAVAGDEASSGLNRRELYMTSSSEEKGDKYIAQLKESGVEELKKYKIEKVIEGEVETTKVFIYKEDYYMGDIVELEDEYGRQSRTRVIEFVMNQDDEGYKSYPTFEVVDDDEENVSEQAGGENG